MRDLPAYAVVTPVKDEADHLPLTIESMRAQSHPPAQWVIVDDGSSDATGAIAAAAAAATPWITVVTTGSNGGRARGAPVVRAFDRGRRELAAPHEFVVKLDGDLFLPAHYFEWVAATFAREPRAGIVGGRLYVHDGREWKPDGVGRHTVHGAVKAYRRACLEEIGGLRSSMGWDGVDEYGARARDWRVIPLSELQVLHYARRGSKQAWWRARIEEGRGAHFMGYLPSFVALRAAYRMAVEQPPVAGGLLLLAGYLGACLRRAPVIDDAAAVAVLRDEQRARMRRIARGAAVEPDVASGGGPSMWALERGPEQPARDEERLFTLMR
jgi:biofilm PGA synthesis N-glycosyltransferase PgaC